MSGFSETSSRTPRFFCESCGAEVSRGSKNCPQCGKRFASVLCPSCGFVGDENSFKKGCPSCGYSSLAPAVNPGGARNFPESEKPAGALPLWVYLLTASAFTAILAALFFTLAQ